MPTPCPPLHSETECRVGQKRTPARRLKGCSSYCTLPTPTRKGWSVPRCTSPELDDQAVGLEPPHRRLGAQPSLTIASFCSCHTFCAAPSPSMPRAAQGQQPLSNLCDTSHPRVQATRQAAPPVPSSPRNGPPPGPAATSFLSPGNLPRRNAARVILGGKTCKGPYYLVMLDDLITWSC